MSKHNNREGAVAWMAANPVAANLVMILCLAGGLLFLFNIKKEFFPDFQIDQVQVSVEYPGANPEEVEQSIVLPIEEAVRGLEGVEEVISTADETYGRVVVEAVRGTNLQKLKDDIQSEVDRITTFPDDAEEPEIKVASHEREVMTMVLYGQTERTTLYGLGEKVRDDLLQHPDITRVSLSGFPGLEIGVEVRQQELRRYGLTLGQIGRLVREQAIDVPGGALETKSGDVLIRMQERLDYGRAFADLPVINTPEGARLPLGDFASVRDGFEDTDYYLRFNGKPAAEFRIYRVGKQTPLDVRAAVTEKLKTISSDLPPGIETAVFSDRAEKYHQRANLLIKNAVLGLLLVILLLGVFLEIRLAFWVMLGIPISFLGSFLLLPALGISLNMISMFAFIIALGIVVDDAIIVGENIYSYRQQGMPPLEAAKKGAKEMVTPVTFSIISNIAAFMPIYFIPGTTGNIFGIIPLVVSSAFAVSLVECLFVLPAHLAHDRAGRSNRLSAYIHTLQQSFSTAFKNWVRNWYSPFLAFVLHHRYTAFLLAVCVLITALAYAGSGRMGMQLFPKAPSDFAFVKVGFPYGTPVEKTQKAVDKLTAAAREVIKQTGYDQLVRGIVVEIGGSGSRTGPTGGGGSGAGSHVATVRVLLAPPAVREKTLSTQAFTRRWRQNMKPVVGADYIKFRSAHGGPGGGGDDINVELRHPRLAVLRKASAELADQLEDYAIVSGVDDGFQPGKPQYDLKMLPRGKALGLTAQDVGRQVRSAFYGARAIRQLRGQNEVDIRVKLPDSQQKSGYYLENFMVRTPSGTFVPLRDVASVNPERAYVSIERRNGRRAVRVTADATPDDRAGEVLADLKQTALPQFEQKYPELSYSFEGMRADIRESMSSLVMTFTLALLAIYAMLAVPFRSYLQPLVVMLCIPFGIVGAVIGHLVMGYGLSVMSMFGVVALAGVVVNDSLILITFANRARETEGVTTREAIHESAIQRFRPVMLTSLTTFCALMPLIFETSRQARMMIPMAISLGFGILFALAITLALVPVLYLTVEDIRSGLNRDHGAG